MPSIEITGGNRLVGNVFAHGAKNAALPILAACVLFDNEEIIIDNVPRILDVASMKEVLEKIGFTITMDEHTMTIQTPSRAELKSTPPESLVSKMRATILLLGGLLSATKTAEIALPGGCSIGYRPIDLHIQALTSMGAAIDLQHGILIADAKEGLNAATVHLGTASVGATENIIIAAVLTPGVTTIENASREPEVLDLIRFLNQAGANITGAGTSQIQITGVKKLHGVRHEIITDRIEVATYMVAAAVTNGDVSIYNTIPKHLDSFITKLREIGVQIDIVDDVIRVRGQESYDTDKDIDIRTAAYPGFHTDMLVLTLPLLLKINGTAMIMDNVFDQRFRHVAEFEKVGANITQLDNMLVINQQQSIVGGKVEATDVRAAAALLLLGVSSKEKITITDLHHLARGYENIIETFEELGADINVLDVDGYERYKW